MERVIVVPLIPIFLGLAAGASSVFGIKKGLDAKSDFDSEKQFNRQDHNIYESSQTSLNDVVDQTSN